MAVASAASLAGSWEHLEGLLAAASFMAPAANLLQNAHNNAEKLARIVWEQLIYT